MTEIWDIVNEKGERLGVTWERQNRDSIPEGAYHPCVEVWVKIDQKLLITQRHPDKDEGLKYDVPGGAALAGEDILIGAVRELKEETGIAVSAGELKRLGSLLCGKAYAVSYLLELDYLPEIQLQPTEVVGYKLVTENELEGMQDDLTRGTFRRYLVYKDKIFNKKAER